MLEIRSQTRTLQRNTISLNHLTTADQAAEYLMSILLPLHTYDSLRRIELIETYGRMNHRHEHLSFSVPHREFQPPFVVFGWTYEDHGHFAELAQTDTLSTGIERVILDISEGAPRNVYNIVDNSSYEWFYVRV